MTTTLGDETKSVFDKGIHGNDIHVGFVAAGTIKIGQPVKLAADGKVEAAAADEPMDNIIGTSIHSRVADENITIATKFRCVIHATSSAALSAGPVMYAGYDATNEVNQYKTSTGAGVTSGYALQAATGADEAILVGQL